MPSLRAGRRVATEVLAGVAFPLLLVGLIVFPAAAATVAEADRVRGQSCGAQSFPLRPATQGRLPWVKARLHSRSLWITDVPVYLCALLLSIFSLWIGFWGFVGGMILIFEPVLWAFGIAAQMGPFTPSSVPQTLLAVPAGFLLALLAVILLTGISLLRDKLHEAFAQDRDPDLLVKLNELRFSRALLTQAFELERQRIERDLHDGAQQEFVAVIMRLGMLEAAAQSSAIPGLASQAAQAREHAEHALERLRQTVRQIHPRELTDLGLIAAIDELAARSPLRIDVDASGDDSFLADPVAAAAYFTISEALTNVVKHAGVHRAHVQLRCDLDGVQLRVADKGYGGARTDAGSGLAGLKERVHSVGGELEIVSPTGHGTAVTASAPCSPPW